MTLPMKPLGQLMPYVEQGLREGLMLSPQSYGIALDPEAKVRALSAEEIEATLSREEAAV